MITATVSPFRVTGVDDWPAGGVDGRGLPLESTKPSACSRRNPSSSDGSSSASASVVRSSEALGLSTRRETIFFNAVAAKNVLTTIESTNP